tara:strand:+ start:488 stop:589 length:102 start_codon:yes stop_codon:yes gene_type:complete
MLGRIARRYINPEKNEIEPYPYRLKFSILIEKK